jgi:magnesium transporter
MFLHLSLLFALVGPLGSRLGGRPNLLPTTTGARRRGVSAALQVAMSGIGPVQTSSPKLPRRPASMVFTKEDPTPTVELYADGTVNQYTSTLTSLRANYKLSTRDVRLLRSSTRVLAPREEYVIFDLGDLKGVLQRDRVILIGADRPAATALADELRQRLVVERDDRELERETPFEVRVVECMLEQTYSLLEEALQRLETMVTDTLAELTDPSQSQREAGREAALGRLLPLQLSLNSLQARTERLASVLEELLDNEEDVADLCLSAQSEARVYEEEDPAILDDGEEVDEAKELKRREVAENLEDEQELVETLLDVYNARLDSLNDRISELATSIETTQVTLELQLDNERNRLARFELTLNMAGLCIGMSAMVSGFFGMNLVSGVENAVGGFWIATVLSTVCSAALFFSCTRRFRNVSLQQRSRLKDVQALKRVLTDVDAVALLLRAKPATDLDRLLESSGVPKMNEREMGLLQSMLAMDSL